MKKIGIAVIALSAALLSVGAGSAFAQTGGKMSNDAMSKDTMHKDTMGKGAMSHDTTGNGNAMSHGKMDMPMKHDAMGSDHPASGTMAH